jgi:hypothetical protein
LFLQVSAWVFSFTVTRKLQELIPPPTSVTVSVTGVLPNGKMEPGPGVNSVSVSGTVLLQTKLLKLSVALQALGGAVMNLWGGQVSVSGSPAQHWMERKSKEQKMVAAFVRPWQRT